MTDLVIRPLTAGEGDLFESLPDPALVGFAAFGDTYTAMAAAGEYRPEWIWVALRAGAVVARAAWWAGPNDDEPLAAQEELDYLRWMPSPREWWRLAFTPAGELVGLSVPSRNYNDPVIGYIAVVPEHRGHGYAYDLLVEATHTLAGEGVDRIVAGTEQTNLPMAAAFTKAGYPITQERIDLI